MFTEKEEEQERGVEQVRDREETPTIKIPRSALLFLARTTYSAEREREKEVPNHSIEGNYHLFCVFF